MSRFEKYKPKRRHSTSAGSFVVFKRKQLKGLQIATNSKLVGKVTLKDFVPLFKTFKMQPK